MMFLQFASKKDRARTFGQIATSAIYPSLQTTLLKDKSAAQVHMSHVLSQSHAYHARQHSPKASQPLRPT